jgi:hypothetical protein
MENNDGEQETMGGVSYGLKGNFHRRAELSSNLGEEKLGRRGFFLFLFFFSKAYLADVLTHTHTYTAV